MQKTPIIKYLLCDDESLFDYVNGRLCPTLNDVKRRLLLIDRQIDTRVPDNYYLLNKEYSFHKIDNLSQVLTKGLSRIANDYLELHEQRIYVKHGMANQWQELITYTPPLLYIASLLHQQCREDVRDVKGIREFYKKWIQPNTKYTALVAPYVPQLEQYVKQQNGLHDLHVHLNGTTETDRVWQDFLANPDGAREQMKGGFKNELTKEQYMQTTYVIRTPDDYWELLKTARRLRAYFFYVLFLSPYNSKKKKESVTPEKLRGYILRGAKIEGMDMLRESAHHPLYSLIYADGDPDSSLSLLSIEALMYVLLLKYLLHTENETLASMFHFYLLILGKTNQLLVQQVNQKGFTQFQKITHNDLRRMSEREYRNRFFQLQGNDKHYIHFLEGRFAPQDTAKKTEKLLWNIETGWEKMKERIFQEQKKELPQLQLIAHFIKKPDKEDPYIRHKSLRLDIWRKAVILSFLKKENAPYLKNVVGIDAASSEFDAPPEVFATVYRMLRRNGFKHFTYHAGEDFYHILSGLRAIYEAVDFCELRCGDRIGHATATGISTQLWKERLGDSLLIPQGQYMDDLLFAYVLINNNGRETPLTSQLKDKIPMLSQKVQEYGFKIYGQYYSITQLVDAWKLRRFCPILLRSMQQADKEIYPLFQVQGLSTFDFEEFCLVRKEIGKQAQKNEVVKFLIDHYHDIANRGKYDELIVVKTEDCFSCEDLQWLQLHMLEYLHCKEIVIETLPTSNVRISHHLSFGTYHLLNWLKWREEGHCIPPIVAGTDDPGIFATNIYNEMANIYCLLTSQKYSHTKAMEIIKELDHNASIYRFE
jgi:adenosine deaminase